FGLAIVAGILFLTAVFQFRFLGKTWPVSAYPPENLVRQGLFAWWRHPIYLFFDLMLLGIGIRLGSEAFLLLVFPLFLLVEYAYIRWEEARLEKRLPHEYPYYRRTTGLLVPRLYQLVRIPFFIVFKILFCYKKKIRPNLLPKPPFFVVARHRNYLDPFLIGTAIPFPISYITTFEMFRKKISRILFKKFFSIPKMRFRADIRCVKQVKKRLGEGGVIGIFPEGERSWTGASGPFKQEVLKLMQKNPSIPILPVRITGNYHAWPRWASGVRKAKITVHVGPPVQLDDKITLEKIESRLKNVLKTDDGPSKCDSKKIVHGLPVLIYRCPVCFEFDTLVVSGSNSLSCLGCNAYFLLHADYSLEFEKNGKTIRQSLFQASQKIRIGEKDLIEIDPLHDAGENLKAGEKILGEMMDCELAVAEGDKFSLMTSEPLLMTDQRILAADGHAEIPISDIRSVTIEGNKKLQLYLPAKNRLYQILFFRSSVLRWSDFLVCLLKTEYNITPNLY
ncbi:1-acyl-sn-glycerol-3-phosphate acyltransferase, partial [candidate division KSB1 bacterium]|nr:1-acyl-sn-glycerol-3-phosphate acyltransferase [candidate division KSB1 bacterium]